MDYQTLQERVCVANKEINQVQLAILTWGNTSEVDREQGVFAIKPSGMDYDQLTPDDIPIVSLESGERIAGNRKPSSDTATHWQLYRTFSSVGGIVHTHSPYATAWAQARREIPCLGTTHADAFYGPVPCTRPLTQAEVETDYEFNTGKVIAEHFAQHALKPIEVPGVLVASHAPFTWGTTAMAAVKAGQTVEEVAKMAFLTYAVNPKSEPVESFLLDKHYLRKHGKDAYYGQP
ncbi:L-ribulose-5-phosphate 4-epimerase AraD [Planctomycetota bacterium]